MARSHGIRLASRCDLACLTCDRSGDGRSLEEALGELAELGVGRATTLRLLGCSPTSVSGLERLVAVARQRGFERVAVETNGAVSDELDLGSVDELIVHEPCVAIDRADELFGKAGAHVRIQSLLARFTGSVRWRVPLLGGAVQEPERALERAPRPSAVELYVPAREPRAGFALRSLDELRTLVARFISAASTRGVPLLVLPNSGVPSCALPAEDAWLSLDRSRGASPLGFSPECAACSLRSRCAGHRPWALSAFGAGAVRPLLEAAREPAPRVDHRRLRLVLLNLIERSFGYGPGAAEHLRAAVLSEPDLEPRVHVEIAHYVGVPSDEAIERLLALEPDLLGVSAYSFTLEASLAVCRGLRRRGAHFPIVFGGPSFALFPRDSSWFDGFDAVDAVAVGSGERTLVELVRHLLAGGRVEPGLSGLAVRDGSRVRYDSPVVEPLDLDALPSPFELGVVHRVERPSLEMARGCVFDCSFCSDARSSRSGGLREHGEERIARDVAHVVGWSEARSVDAGASTANVTEAFFRRACDAVRKGDPGMRLRYGFQLHPSLVTSEQRAALEGIRIDTLHLGVQSLTRETFRSMRRGSTVSHVERAVTTLEGAGPLELSLILGLPGESYASFVGSFERLLEMGPARLVVNRLLVLPGTPYHLHRRVLGLEFDRDRYYRVVSTPDLSREDLRRCQDYVIERTLRLPDLFASGEARVRWLNFDVQRRFGDPPEYG